VGPVAEFSGVSKWLRHRIMANVPFALDLLYTIDG
jgi:hypothetical protein